MFGTRSRSPMGPAIEPSGTSGRTAVCGLIVAHGSPSDPDRLDEILCRLARRVAQRAPGWRIQAATLGKRGSVKTAISTVGPGELITVYPFFMSDGWFVSEELPRRLSELTDGPVSYLAPLGLDPALPELCRRRAREVARKIGSASSACTLILAAHGSRSSSKPAQSATRIKDQIIDAGEFADVRLGFINEAPSLAEVAVCAAPAICLPLFATRAGHVEFDVPSALTEAGFTGPILAPIGDDPEVPSLIAAALRSSHSGWPNLPATDNLKALGAAR